jgi:hypothetical protein
MFKNVKACPICGHKMELVVATVCCTHCGAYIGGSGMLRYDLANPMSTGTVIQRLLKMVNKLSSAHTTGSGEGASLEDIIGKP